jgi:hypothetical protein
MNISRDLRLKRKPVAVFATISTALILLSMQALGDVVTDWNQTTLKTLDAIGQRRTPPSGRLLAMVHTAMHDSINAIDRRYRGYAINIQADPNASPEAAGAAAAHAVLLNQIPSQQANLDAALAASLASIPDGGPKSEGISIGETVAAVVLALRSNDGSTVTLPYTQAPGPGIFQPVPPASAVFVAWGKVTPFTLKSGSQFRAKGPPALSSDDYTRDFNEVKSLGAANSTTRTQDQTDAARFWDENAQIGWNTIARILSAQQDLDLWENARFFALINLAGADASIAVFDTKYTYNFWRPKAAIHAADTDGNPDTIADPTWTSLLSDVAHPDYVSQHTAYSAAVAKVISSFFDTDEISFSFATSTAPDGLPRTYHSLSQTVEEISGARVWAGIHFRTACKDAQHQGRQIGHWVFHKFLRPINKHHHLREVDEK